MRIQCRLSGMKKAGSDLGGHPEMTLEVMRDGRTASVRRFHCAQTGAVSVKFRRQHLAGSCLLTNPCPFLASCTTFSPPTVTPFLERRRLSETDDSFSRPRTHTGDRRVLFNDGPPWWTLPVAGCTPRRSAVVA